MERSLSDDCFDITWPTTPPECDGVCRGADGRVDQSGVKASGWAYLDEIEEAAKRGCQKCAVVFHCCRNMKPLKGRIDVGCSFTNPGQIQQVWKWLKKRSEHKTMELPTIQLYVQSGAPKPAWDFIKNGRFPMTTRREEHQSILAAWETECEARHANCVTRHAALPRRVLDVGNKIDPRLLLHVSSEEIGNYVALSHCWGPEHLHPPETNLSNLRQRQEGIELSTLPSTFRDAVLVTRSLGIQYLWIDSLCMVQDDSCDWQTESSKMAGYYSDAYLVIAAAQAEDSTQGFLDVAGVHPHLNPDRAVEIGQITNPNSTISRIYKRRLKSDSSATRHHGLLHAAPLNQRAWALQEYILAKRIVHFTKGEMLWECAECLRCECMEMDHTTDDISVHPGIMRKGQFLLLRYQEDGVSLHELWLGLLEAYSSRDLSYDSDLLPALSGLAKLWQSRGAGKYLAGFWNEYILESMVWQVLGLSPSQIQRSTEYRAPSWSPFSLEEKFGSKNRRTRLSFRFPTDHRRLAERCAVVLDAGSTPTGADPTGQITSAFLRIRGRIIRENASSEQLKLRGEDVHIRFDVDMNFGEGIDLTFLLIGHNTLGGLIVLVLQPSRKSGVYERVGITSRYNREGSRELASQFLAVKEETVVVI
ncbi:hypothetical protein GCG54_00014291 [Colletotrichum gloeosporioides]|uniref:Heterokaryon incompatibility domain-containing protein n=1 Tax=Colletotrichum gloeosporioides TaxID=474922 RepID=A0A8H4CF42_COLGL|nr:uncharacterized protein GCG54_00014291 [Colletotrichum gloeosporioides]KAF3802584.1 hypothetical protein GCG54_00014291 [Colletotrichum gloeosporioides]